MLMNIIPADVNTDANVDIDENGNADVNIDENENGNVNADGSANGNGNGNANGSESADENKNTDVNDEYKSDILLDEPLVLNLIPEYPPVICEICGKSFKNVGYGEFNGHCCSGMIANGTLHCGWGSKYDLYQDFYDYSIKKRSDIKIYNSETLEPNSICDCCIDEWVRLGKLYSDQVSSACICCNSPFSSLSDFISRAVVYLGEDIVDGTRKDSDDSEIYYMSGKYRADEFKIVRSKLNCAEDFLWLCEYCIKSRKPENKSLGKTKSPHCWFPFGILIPPIIDIIFSYHDRHCSCPFDVK